MSSARQASSNLTSQQFLVVAISIIGPVINGPLNRHLRERFPNHLGTRDGFHGKQSFHGQELRRGWSRDGPSISCLLCHRYSDRRWSSGGHVSEGERLEAQMKLGSLAHLLPPAVQPVPNRPWTATGPWPGGVGGGGPLI